MAIITQEECLPRPNFVETFPPRRLMSSQHLSELVEFLFDAYRAVRNWRFYVPFFLSVAAAWAIHHYLPTLLLKEALMLLAIGAGAFIGLIWWWAE